MKPERKREIIRSLEMCVDLTDKNLENYFNNLCRLGSNLVAIKSLTDLGRFFNILGNETRLMIIKLLIQKDYCVCELEAILDKSQSSLSHHLKLLEKSGLIRGIKRGYFTHYEIIREQFEKYKHLFEEDFPFKK